MNITLETLGINLLNKRGDIGIRRAAEEIGISPTTLSRVENGHIPDLQTFRKICSWMGIDAGAVLGSKLQSHIQSPQVGVHFRKDQTLDKNVAQSLANMILAAQRAMSTNSPEEEI